MQPGLALVLSATTGTNTTRYVHGPRGIHAQQDNAGAWDWLLQDGLGSVRAVVDGTLAVQERRMYAPYGEPYDGVGTSQTVYGFTGEPTDANELVYLRARYYNPNIGVFTALDPFEGVVTRPMSLNGYSWVEGKVPNATDPSGKQLPQSQPSGGQQPNLTVVYPAPQAYSNAPRYADYPHNDYETTSPGYYGQYLVIPRIVNTPVGYIDTSRIGEFGYSYPVDLLSVNGQCVSPALFEPGPTPYLTVINLQSTTAVSQQPSGAAQTQAQQAQDNEERPDRQAGCTIPEGYDYASVGVVIHQQIQALFIGTYGAVFAQTEGPVVPRAAKDGSGGAGRPDAVLYMHLILRDASLPAEVYEIKPIGWGPTGNAHLFDLGRQQLARYVENFWRSERAVDGVEGVVWNPDGIRIAYSLDPRQAIVLYTFYNSAPGMVYYACERR